MGEGQETEGAAAVGRWSGGSGCDWPRVVRGKNGRKGNKGKMEKVLIKLFYKY